MDNIRNRTSIDLTSDSNYELGIIEPNLVDAGSRRQASAMQDSETEAPHANDSGGEEDELPVARHPARKTYKAKHVENKHRVQKNQKDRSPIDEMLTTSIFASLSALRASGKFSDMVIRCGGRDFKAHRVVVCSQSSYFDNAIADWVLTETGAVELDKEEDPDVFEHFLEFLYTGTYNNGPAPVSTKPADVSMLEPEEVVRKLATRPGVQVGGSLDDDEMSDTTEKYESDAYDEISDDMEAEDEVEDDDETEEAESSSDKTANGNGPGKTVINSKTTNTANKCWNVNDEVAQGLFLPLRLYVMATKFRVAALKLLARYRFYRAAESTWRHAECFTAVVDELYKTTPETDVGMREIVCRLVGSGIREDGQRERMGPVMAKHGQFALGVINYMIAQEKTVW